LRKILRIQRHDEIRSASFRATAERIVSRIGRDVWKGRGRNRFRLLSKQIDYLPDEVAPYAKLSLNLGRSVPINALVGIDGTIPPESSATRKLARNGLRGS
jgi:hypothetical protein